MTTDSAFGKYRLIAELGHGGMADVYLAVVRGPSGLGFSKLQVIKRLRPNLVEDPDFIAMLIDEARIAARLNHPNVVQTIEVGEVDGQYFIAMEFLDGQPLHRVLHRAERMKTPLPATLQYRILADALAGLHHAHELADYDGTPLQVIHRDMTPHNLFVSYEGQVKVVDFGVAKALGRASETRTGVVKGKITYMAPEQALAKELDRRADVFSVGVMFWEAAAGVRMWKGKADIEIMNRLLSGDVPTSPRSANPDVSEALDQICRRALALRPEDRYATAADFQNDLESFLEDLESAGAAVSQRGGARVHATNREIGRVVSELFEDKRKHLRDVIERQLAIIKSEDTSRTMQAPVSADSLVPPSTSTPSLTLQSVGEVVAVGRLRGGGPAAVPPAQDATAATLVTSGDSRVLGVRRRSARFALILAALLAVTGAVWVRTVRSRAGAEPPSAETSAAVSASHAEEKPPTPAGNPETIMMTLRASPSKARFVLDEGAPVENPFAGKFPRDGKEHALRIEADGYVAKTRQIVFDKDVVLDVALDKEPKKAVERYVPPPPPPTSTPITKPGKRPIDTGDPWGK